MWSHPSAGCGAPSGRAGAADDLRVTVIATGFGRRDGGPGLFTIEPDRPRPRDRSERRTPRMDDRQRPSLEIGDDDIDVPSFLKD